MMRIGHGYDIHRLEQGRRLVLGGVEIPSEYGLLGHSDADCLSHAIADAILGAMGLKDIGFYFPNNDPSIAGIDSQEIIKKAVVEAGNRGYRVGNVDASIIAEKPKIGPYVDGMKQRLSASLNVDPSEIGVKATTHEQVGDLGKGLAIAAHAVVLMLSR